MNEEGWWDERMGVGLGERGYMAFEVEVARVGEGFTREGGVRLG